MAKLVETRCPMCDTPRPRGAHRCACNYVFEYETSARASRSMGHDHGHGRPPDGIVVTVLATAVIAALAAGLLMPAYVEPKRYTTQGVLLALAGVFSIAGAVFDWWFFFGNRRARLIVALAGRTGARIFYALLGGVLLGIAIAMLR